MGIILMLKDMMSLEDTMTIVGITYQGRNMRRSIIVRLSILTKENYKLKNQDDVNEDDMVT
jgi:hypothetical protein